VYHAIMLPISEVLEIPEGYTLFFLLFIGVPILLFVLRLVVGLQPQRGRRSER